jgi:hypothetical protein
MDDKKSRSLTYQAPFAEFLFLGQRCVHPQDQRTLTSQESLPLLRTQQDDESGLFEK